VTMVIFSPRARLAAMWRVVTFLGLGGVAAAVAVADDAADAADGAAAVDDGAAAAAVVAAASVRATSSVDADREEGPSPSVVAAVVASSS